MRRRFLLLVVMALAVSPRLTLAQSNSDESATSTNVATQAKDDPYAAYGGEMMFAATCDHLETVKRLLKSNPALVNQTNSVGMTPLHEAAFGGNERLMAVLLSAKANVNARDIDGLTPLHWAANALPLQSAAHAVVAKMLLSHGAKVNARDKQGRTPLTWAEYHPSNEVVEVLLKYGAKN